MATLTIEDRTATGTPIGHIDLPDMPDRITLRDLIRLRVREEVARYNLRPSRSSRGSSSRRAPCPSDARSGSPSRGGWTGRSRPDVACESFERNGFFVLVNRKQVTELDDTIELVGTVDIGFIKLTPLVGG